MITNKERKALWQCLEDSRFQVNEMKKDRAHWGDALIASEEARLKLARSAYMKIKKATQSKGQL